MAVVKTIILALGVLLSLSAVTTNAWGVDGHFAVCKIAQVKKQISFAILIEITYN